MEGPAGSLEVTGLVVSRWYKERGAVVGSREQLAYRSHGGAKLLRMLGEYLGLEER